MSRALRLGTILSSCRASRHASWSSPRSAIAASGMKTTSSRLAFPTFMPGVLSPPFLRLIPSKVRLTINCHASNHTSSALLLAVYLECLRPPPQPTAPKYHQYGRAERFARCSILARMALLRQYTGRLWPRSGGDVPSRRYPYAGIQAEQRFPWQ